MKTSAARDLEEAIRHVMSSPEGRRFVKRILQQAGVDQQVGESPYHAGAHDLGVRIKADIYEACYETLHTMEVEYRQDLKRYKAAEKDS